MNAESVNSTNVVQYLCGSLLLLGEKHYFVIRLRLNTFHILKEMNSTTGFRNGE